MRHLIFYLSILGLPLAASSQSLTPTAVGSSGGDFTTPGFHLSISVGDLAIQTYTAGTHILTQGFQQPFPPGTPLPLEWLSFSGTLVNGAAELEWVTAHESNTSYFDVERSADGNHFEKFTQVKAAGNSTTATTYHATDPHPYDGRGYYRIRQVDLDGKSSYSSIVAISSSTSGTNWTLYPNPAHNQLVSAIHLAQPRLLVLDLYSISGQLLISRQAMCPAGSTLLQWDVDMLPAGIYLVRCRGNELPMLKFTKE